MGVGWGWPLGRKRLAPGPQACKGGRVLLWLFFDLFYFHLLTYWKSSVAATCQHSCRHVLPSLSKCSNTLTRTHHGLESQLITITAAVAHVNQLHTHTQSHLLALSFPPLDFHSWIYIWLYFDILKDLKKKPLTYFTPKCSTCAYRSAKVHKLTGVLSGLSAETICYLLFWALLDFYLQPPLIPEMKPRSEQVPCCGTLQRHCLCDSRQRKVRRWDTIRCTCFK